MQKSILGIWLLIMLICVVPAVGIQFDGDLKSIGMVPDEILRDEMNLKKIWGGIRDQSLIFSIGSTQQQALQTNDSVYETMNDKAGISFLSLSPIIPSVQTQKNNLDRWNAFWHDQGVKEAVINDLKTVGAEFGFTSNAFDPFEQWLQRIPQPFTPDDFIREGNDKMILPFLGTLKNGNNAILTFAPDDEQILSPLNQCGPTVKVVSNQKFSEQLNRETVSDFTRFFTGAVIIICFLIAVLFRNFKKFILAITPVFAGLIVMAALMNVLDMRINLFNMVASILVIGLAADYGIFIVCNSQTECCDTTRNAVLVSGLTTFIGFGSLVLARHPSMFSIGITVATGIIPSLACSLTLLPYLCQILLKRNTVA